MVSSSSGRFAWMAERPLLVLVLSGVLLRMLLMPFFCHVDLYSEFRRVVNAVEKDIYFPHQNRLATFYVEFLFLKLFSPLLKSPELVFFLEDQLKTTANLVDYFVFVNHPSVFRHLFIFKLPYLVFDVLTMLVIWRFFDNKRHAKLALLLWVFNPVTLYAVYIFGRYEIIPIFFVAMTVLLLKNQRFLTAAVFLGLAINGREIYVVTAPIFLLAVFNSTESFRVNAQRMTLSAGILVFSIAFPVLIEKLLGLQTVFSQGQVYDDGRANVLFGLAHQWLYPLLFAYFLTLMFVAAKPFTSSDHRYLLGAGVVIAAYFIFAGHSAHYVAWLPLFPIMLMRYHTSAGQVVFALGCFFVAWFLYRAFLGDINLFTLFLAAPFNFDLTLFPGIPGIYTHFIGDTNAIYAYDKVLNALHTMFAATLVFLIWHMNQANTSAFTEPKISSQ